MGPSPPSPPPTASPSRPSALARFLSGPSDPGRRWPLLAFVFAVALGTLGGIGLTTFQYAEGLSYLRRDPEACKNCHIMQSQYDSWGMSSHHTVAVCVDCHLPHQFVPKYLAKAENGWRHGKLFTTGGFKEPIEIQGLGRRILQANCVNCHRGITHSMNEGSMEAPDWAMFRPGVEVECIHCHATVGHGKRVGLGGPLTTEELRHD